MDRLIKYNALFIAFGFVFISFYPILLEQFYYEQLRSICIGWGMLLILLINFVFDWRNEKKAVA